MNNLKSDPLARTFLLWRGKIFFKKTLVTTVEAVWVEHTKGYRCTVRAKYPGTRKFKTLRTKVFTEYREMEAWAERPATEIQSDF